MSEAENSKNNFVIMTGTNVEHLVGMETVGSPKWNAVIIHLKDPTDKNQLSKEIDSIKAAVGENNLVARKGKGEIGQYAIKHNRAFSEVTGLHTIGITDEGFNILEQKGAKEVSSLGELKQHFGDVKPTTKLESRAVTGGVSGPIKLGSGKVW